MKLHPFVNDVAGLRFDNCFNPYVDRCVVHDSYDAPRRRASALSTLIESAVQGPVDAIWVGRDLGYKGGRRTGLALTDDVHVDEHAKRWNCSVERATVGAAVIERTAAVIWSMLSRIDARIFLWNVFPLHPHEPSDPFTNRQHIARERAAGEDLLQTLIDVLRPLHLVAVGNDAAAAVGRVSGTRPVIAVRHPSYGGQSQFVSQITSQYSLRAPAQRCF